MRIDLNLYFACFPFQLIPDGSESTCRIPRMPLVELIFMFFFIWSSSSLSFHHLVTFHSLLTHCLCHSPSWLLLISSLYLCIFPKLHFSFLFFSFLTNDRNPGLISSRRCTRSPSQPRVQAACRSGSSLQSEKRPFVLNIFE